MVEIILVNGLALCYTENIKLKMMRIKPKDAVNLYKMAGIYTEKVFTCSPSGIPTCRGATFVNPLKLKCAVYFHAKQIMICQ